MPSNKITNGLAVIVFLIFFIYFVSLPSLVKEKHVEGLIHEISISALRENWSETEQLFNQYKQIWNNRKYYLQLNNGETDFNNMEEATERLKAGIQSRDKSSVVSDCQVMTVQWQNMNKIVPSP